MDDLNILQGHIAERGDSILLSLIQQWMDNVSLLKSWLQRVNASIKIIKIKKYLIFDMFKLFLLIIVSNEQISLKIWK